MLQVWMSISSELWDTTLPQGYCARLLDVRRAAWLCEDITTVTFHLHCGWRALRTAGYIVWSCLEVL